MVDKLLLLRCKEIVFHSQQIKFHIASLTRPTTQDVIAISCQPCGHFHSRFKTEYMNAFCVAFLPHKSKEHFSINVFPSNLYALHCCTFRYLLEKIYCTQFVLFRFSIWNNRNEVYENSNIFTMDVNDHDLCCMFMYHYKVNKSEVDPPLK